MPFLGAARTAAVAGWGEIAPAFVSRVTTTTQLLGGFAGYPYENYQGSKGSLQPQDWTYDGTGASTTAWGSFSAQTMYIPTAAFEACESYGNGAVINLFRADFFDDTYSFLGISPNLQYSGTTGIWALNANAPGGNGYFTDSFDAATLFGDRWVTWLISVYMTDAFYSNWTGGTGTYYFRAYAYDTFTGETIWNSDQVGSNSDTGFTSLYKSYSAVYGINDRGSGQVGFGCDVLSQFWPGSSPNPLTQIKLANFWFNMGSNLDPAEESLNFRGFATPGVAETPWLWINPRNSGDWEAGVSNYYIDNDASARISGGTSGPSPGYDWTFSSIQYTPALTYL